jgi:nicotinamidase-related amidase
MGLQKEEFKMDITVTCKHDRHFNFDPVHTALMIIDMQRDFLDQGGMCDVLGENTTAMRAIIPRLKRVLHAARDWGLTVIHTREGYAPDLSDMHGLKRERYGTESEGPLGRFLIRGQPGHETISELFPLPEETVIDKPGFGSFYRTDLEQHLSRQKITHLIISGVTTQCCVHSTLREAVDRGFYCLTLADCCAAIDQALHDKAISLIYGEGHLFGWVAESPDFLAVLEQNEHRIRLRRIQHPILKGKR